MRGSAATMLLACACVCALAASARAQIAFAPCSDTNDFACGRLTVPLDPSGVTPGTLTLSMRRHRAPVGEARSAIVALAGGPGQPAVPFSEQFSELLGSIAATRDLIVFDQRGIGLSHPLSCHALERPGQYRSFGAVIEACASQLGPTRAFYTTADTVADIEAIRQAGGYEKLVLYGTSYGTKVAEQYAQAYPSHVEALVLDSVVTPNGPDPLSRSTFAAVPRVLRELCVDDGCAHVTSEPVADLARVVRRMLHAPLHGRVIDGTGKAHTVRVDSDALLGMLLAGDFSPLLRAEFLTSVRAAALGDTAPLARLLAMAESSGEGERQDFDTPLYYATTCEEEPFPWSRAADPRARLAQAVAAVKALPASALAPFTAANVLDLGVLAECARWPYTTPAPPPEEAPFPNVPALILSGAADLRTPTANAREVAAEIPDSQLLVVPNTGHSVLGAEIGSCAKDALRAIFAAHPVKPCRATPLPAILRPPPLPPVRLALVSPTHGYSGLPGRTLHAVTLTLGDFARQLVQQIASAASEEGPLTLSTLRGGGLRAGWEQLVKGQFVFHDYTYVPGVTLSGTIKREALDLEIGGSAAAHGTLRLGAHNAIVGTLGGRRVDVSSSPTATAAIVGLDAEVRSHVDARGPAARAAARELAGIVGRFLWR